MCRAQQLRLSKVSELIHNSTNHKHLDSAKVSVYFQEIIDLVRLSTLNYPGILTFVKPTTSCIPEGSFCLMLQRCFMPSFSGSVMQM